MPQQYEHTFVSNGHDYGAVIHGTGVEVYCIMPAESPVSDIYVGEWQRDDNMESAAYKLGEGDWEAVSYWDFSHPKDAAHWIAGIAI